MVFAIVFLLGLIIIELKGLQMDTTALKSNFSDFTTSFNKFASDFATFLATLPQDTPQQIADVKAVSDGLAGFKAQVDALDTAINPPAPPAPGV